MLSINKLITELFVTSLINDELPIVLIGISPVFEPSPNYSKSKYGSQFSNSFKVMKKNHNKALSFKKNLKLPKCKFALKNVSVNFPEL